MKRAATESFVVARRALQAVAPVVSALSFVLALGAVPARAQLPPSARDVALRVVDAKGGPIQELRFRVYGALGGGDRYRVLPGQEGTLQPRDFTDDYARLAGLPDGDLVLALEADGHALTLSEPFRLPAKSPVRLTVRLQVGVSLRGKVTAPDGTAVAGAQVRLLARDDDNQHPMARQLGRMFAVPVTTTSVAAADDGSFRIDHVAPGDYVVRAVHDDWADARLEVGIKGRRDKRLGELQLAPGRVLAGAVVRGGKRVAGAAVVLQSAAKPRPGGVPFQAVHLEVRADDQGRFTLPRVPLGTYQLGAHEGGDPMAQARQLSGSQRSVELKAQLGGGAQLELVVLPDR